MAFVEFHDVKKVYQMGQVRIEALRDVNFEVEKGEFCVVVGASGAGKTTILNILGGMDTLSEGSVWLDGKEISSYNKRQLTEYRRFDIGFVFQFYNLVQNLTALENVELAAQLCKDPLPAASVLEAVGLKERMSNFPAQLSGGEQQRVAIARALAKNPKLLLCDEPTGALDYNTGKAVLKLLQDTCRNNGVTVIVITHNQAITAMADRIITVRSGTVVSEEKNTKIIPVEQIEWKRIQKQNRRWKDGLFDDEDYPAGNPAEFGTVSCHHGDCRFGCGTVLRTEGHAGCHGKKCAAVL